MLKKLLYAALVAAALAAPAASYAANPLEQLGGILSNLTSKNNFDLKELEGTWNYVAPAITFKSDNALNKIGGAAASAGVESKLAPYYKRLGLDKAVLTFDAEGNFSIKLRATTLKGTVVRDEETPEGYVTFRFNALGKTNIGRVNAQVSKSATGEITLTFDASKVIAVVDKVATFTGNKSVQALSKILNSYDGVFAGARLKKAKGK